MKKFIVLSIVLLIIAGFAITSSAVPLMAGKDINVGELTIQVVEVAGDDFLVVTYTITDLEWELEDTHLYVGTVPPTKSAPGRFPYGPESEHIVIDEVYIVEYSIPLTDFITDFTKSTTLYIAAHAEVTNQTEEETAWAEGCTRGRSHPSTRSSKKARRYGRWRSWTPLYPT